MAWYVGKTLQRDMEQLLADQQFASVGLVAGQITSDIEERMSALKSISKLLTPDLLANRAALQTDLERRAVLNRLFNRGIFVTDPSGLAIASSPTSAGRLGLNFMDKEHVAVALKEGRANISRPTVGKTLGAPVIVMSVPIFDGQSKVIGAFMGVTDLGAPNFFDRVTEGRFGKTGSFVLVSPQHRQIITAGDKRRAMEMLPPPGRFPLIDRFIDGYEGAGVMVNPVGVEVLAAAKKIPVTGWYVAVQLPTEEAFAPVMAMKQRLQLSAIMLTLLVGVVTWWLVRREMQPMSIVIDTLSRWSESDLPLGPLPVKRQDEVGQLITGFNRLLASLTDREARAREAQTLLAGVASRVPGVVYQFRLRADGTSCFPYASEGIRDIYRVAPEDVKDDASRVFAVLHPDDYDNVAASIQMSAERLLPWRQEYRVKFDDGVERWLHGNAIPHREESGDVLWHGFITDITERKMADAALQASDRRFTDLLRNISSVAVKGFSADDTVHYWNSAAEKLYGYTELEAIGRPVVELVIPYEGKADHLGELAHIARTGQPNPACEKTFKRKDGSQFQAYTCHGVLNTPGHPMEVYCFAIDLTEQKQMAREVQRQRDFASQVMNAMGQGLSVTNARREFEYVNQAFAQMLGYDAEKIIGKSARDFIVDEDNVKQEREQAQRLRGVASAYEVRLKRSDGSIVPVEIFGVPRSVDGKYAGSIAVLTDLTERKRAESVLQESEKRFRMLIELSPEASVVHCSGVIVYANPAALKLYAAKAPEELLGRKMMDFVHPDSRDIVIKRVTQLAEGSATVLPIVELKNFTLNGEVIEIESQSVATVFNGVPAVRISIRDVTARNRAERQRASLEAQLRESQKMEAIGTLAGGVAHDFNNILAAILGNAELAYEDVAGNVRALESLDEIRKAAARARELVKQILSFSRRQPTERKPIRLEPVIEESRRLLRATMPGRLSLAVRCEENIPLVLADATQIQQAIINLVTNAMQAISTGQGLVELTLAAPTLDDALVAAHPGLASMRERHPGRVVRLSVKDTGPGIPQDALARIFEPFFTTKPVNEGTGLGLSVVHGIVETHEGVIEVESTLDVGTEFTIFLPTLALELPRTDEVPSSAPSGASTSNTRLSAPGLRVICLDDDEAMLFLLGRLLSRRGMQVSTFSDQQAAIDAIREAPENFDVLVTDYNMPGMSGVDVAIEVRKIRPDLPLILASGFVDDSVRQHAKSAGIGLVVFKETVVENFADAIARAATTL